MSIYSILKRIHKKILLKKKRLYLDSLIQKGLKLGQDVEIIDTFFFDPSHCFLISIGDNCTICPNVRLIAHDASTKKHLGYTKIGRIDIKENCFLGDSVIVLPNVKIGPNSIIGAGSIVTNGIPPDSVAAGNPAKVISTLDSYIRKIKHLQEGKKIFDENYFINNLNDVKRKEIALTTNHSIGFIL